MKRAWLCVCALLLAACAQRAPVHEDAGTLSVVTLNLWHDKSDWPARQGQIVATLRRLHPDVIALQEVLQHETLPNQAETLAHALGDDWRFVSVDKPDAARRYGNAVLTRHRILAVDWAPLQPLDDWRTVAHVRLALDAGAARTLDVYATHLHHTDAGAAIRAQQVGDLIGYIDRTRSADATLVLGDFNAPADAPELAALAARFDDAYDTLHPDALQDAPAHSTLNLAYYAPLRIDHVWFDPTTAKVLTVQRLFDTPDANGAWASDHFGIQATLRLGSRSAPRPTSSNQSVIPANDALGGRGVRSKVRTARHHQRSYPCAQCEIRWQRLLSTRQPPHAARRNQHSRSTNDP